MDIVDEISLSKDTTSDVVNEIPKDKTEIMKEKPNDKPKGVTNKLPCVDNLKDKVSDIVKEKPKDKPKGQKDKMKGVTDKAPCVHNVKDKVLDIVIKSRVPKDKVSDIVDNVKDQCSDTRLLKDKANDKLTGKLPGDAVNDMVLDVINEKRKTDVMKDKPKDKAPSVVKSKVSTELPKYKTKDKVDLHKDKSKPKVKNNVKSEVPILRSRSKCKPEVKAKAYVRVLKSNENMDIEYSNSELDSDEVDFESSALIKSQKIKTKAELKRKMKGGLDSDSSSLDEEKERPIEHDLVRLWSDHVFPKELKDILIDGGNVSNRDDDNDHLNVDDDLNDKDPMSSNPSFGFSKVNLDDFDKQLSGSVRRLTPDRMGTRASKVSLIPKKWIVKPSSYLLSPYMNKKTKVVPKITRLEFTIGNYLFAMQGDKMEKVFESHSGEFIMYGVSLNMETLAPGLWIDANTKSMFDRTLVCDDGKWESFSNQVKAQPKGKESGLTLEGLIWHSRYDMLRQLRFKFSTKILLHEVNVHAKKKLNLATEFDKVDAHERMSIIVEAMKKREERDHI
nr:hypothetical protein [Tanacetum cinerariifolium]